MMSFIEGNIDHNTSSPSYQYRGAFYQPDKAAGVIHSNKESQKRDPSDNLLQDINKYKEIMREWAEFQDLARRIRATSQQHITMSDVLMLQWLSSFRPSVSQNNTNITTNNTDVPQENHGALPIGLRVLSCNRCLEDNWLEMIFSSVETEALTKVVHLCDLEVVASKEDDEPRNSPILIQERQNHLMAILRKAVNFLARIYEEEEADLPLQVEELQNHRSILPHMQNTELPIFKLWIDKEDCIDLGNIDHKNTTNIENGKRWVYRTIEKEATPKKIIKINRSELIDFLNIARSTFRTFVVKSTNGTDRYFLMHIVFRRHNS
jgi:hypothetical protein